MKSCQTGSMPLLSGKHFEARQRRTVMRATADFLPKAEPGKIDKRKIKEMYEEK